MQAGEIIFIIVINSLIICVLYFFLKKSLEKRIKHLKNEVQDLEDLVAAIIGEFEDIAELTEAKMVSIQNSISEKSPFAEIASITEPESSLNIEAEDLTIENERQNDQLPIESQPNDEINFGLQENRHLEEQPQNKRMHRPVKDPRHQRILDLWGKGVTIEEIAKQLGIGRGEVQLILGIYRRS